MQAKEWVVRYYLMEGHKPSRLALCTTEKEARRAAASMLRRSSLRGVRTWYDSSRDRAVYALPGDGPFVTLGLEAE